MALGKPLSFNLERIMLSLPPLHKVMHVGLLNTGKQDLEMLPTLASLIRIVGGGLRVWMGVRVLFSG